MKKITIAIIAIIILGIVGFATYKLIKKEDPTPTQTDAQKFASEYTEIDEDNIFVYRKSEEIIKILENGSGVVYIGFKECKWCQQYITYLHDVATSVGLEKIFYLDILEERENNSENYQRIVEILKDYLEFDSEGNPRIYVPEIIVLEKGEIIGHDNETAYDTKGYSDPKEYWNEDRVTKLKTKLKTMMLEISDNSCSECN